MTQKIDQALDQVGRSSFGDDLAMIDDGEAVGVGLIYAAELARHLGRIDVERVAAHYLDPATFSKSPMPAGPSPGSTESPRKKSIPSANGCGSIPLIARP